MAAALPLRSPALAPVPRSRTIPVFALTFAAVIATLSLVPYLLAYLWTPPGQHFAGFFFIADDATTYLAKMRQGAEGAWLWTDPYTSEPHGGVFLFGFYLLLGHLTALLHLPLIAGYHLARISGAFALIVAADRLCRRLLDPSLRRLAVALVILGSGLGFLVQAAGNPSVMGTPLQALDLHLPELSGWYSILAIPHFTWATALIVVALLGLLSIEETPRLRPILLTSLALLALTAIHPQMIPVLGLIWAAYQGVLLIWGLRPRWSSLAAEALPFAATLPLLGYSAWILYRDPVVARWASQWRHQAPDPISLALSLGLPLALAITGIAIAWRRRDRALALALVWPPLVFVLLYLPNFANIQRRLLDALYVPLGMLAAVGLSEVSERLPARWARRTRAALVAACCVSSLIVLAIALRFASGAFSEAYVNSDAWQAMQWLSSHHRPGDRALSAPSSGELLPAWSGVQVYVGHYSETLDYFQKIHNVQQVLQPGESPAALWRFMSANGITLLYWGPDEARTGFDPAEDPSLVPIYHDATVTVYRVQERPASSASASY
jgi:hypothetical protein